MEDVTRVLNAMSTGDSDPETRLMELIYDELRGMAAAKLAREGGANRFQPTELVNEAYLRLAGYCPEWRNRQQFFGAASEAMRRILVEAARHRCRAKRGGGVEPVTLHEDQAALPEPDERILLVHEALDQLEVEDAEKARIVKLRYFVGLGNGEIAKILGVNERTVRRHYEEAKFFLYRRIKSAP